KWWATKTRYPPDIAQNGGQQKHVTHPTLLKMVGNKNPLPTLQNGYSLIFILYQLNQSVLIMSISLISVLSIRLFHPYF
ncbi:MAG: hypothetical protein DRR00_19035, partial [Candidatus Parabeggiatoa sp. nov. 3]